MKPHLFDMLEEKAGGFMTRAEAKSVRNAEDPMGWLIEILLGKGDKEFNTFCDGMCKLTYAYFKILEPISVCKVLLGL